jgi:IS30 family transposase
MTFVRTRLGYWTYKADYAQSNYDNRKKCKNKYVKFTEQIKVFVREKIKEDWNPDQICGYAKINTMFHLSHEWIYQFILKDKSQGGDLYKHLRHQNKK